MNKKEFDKIMEWCYKNNTMKLEEDIGLRIVKTDGGWVNVIKLQRFLEEMVGGEK